MVTDLVQIRALAGAKEQENLEFRRFWKTRRYPDRLLRSVAEEVQRQIDCTACAACCRELRVAVSNEDIGRIAAYLGATAEQVVEQYTMADPDDGERILRQSAGGCVFLDGNLCMVYEARPRGCREFPHTARRRRSLGARMPSIFGRASLCPIVYNTIEECKKRVSFTEHENSGRECLHQKSGSQ